MRGFSLHTEALSTDTIGTKNIYYANGLISLGTRLRSLIGLWILWHQRWRQRRDLANLDAHLLRDIGVTPREAFRETSKPFWQK